METKICCICKVELPITKFYINKLGRPFYRCRPCHNAKVQEYHSNHRELRIIYNRNYRQKNKESIAKKAQQYNKLHKQKEAERKRQWYLENIEHVAQKNKGWRMAHAKEIKAYARRYKKLFVSPEYTVEDIRPRSSMTPVYTPQTAIVPIPLPTDWNVLAKQSHERILTKWSPAV